VAARGTADPLTAAELARKTGAARSANGHGRSDRDTEQDRELQALEARLAEADGRRVWAQQRARDDLAQRGLPVTRIDRRPACELLDAAE
jgi:hypothetical protein